MVTTAALGLLLVVLVVAAVSPLRVALAASVMADLALNYFFMPPFHTFTIADPENWVALFVFLAVGTIGSSLSSAARARAREAIERRNELAELFEARKAAEVAQQGEALKSALLASLAHELRTPLTTITIAANNLNASWLESGGRREQCDLILAEVERLNHLFRNIVDMARIDAGAVTAERQWVHPAEISEAAQRQVEHLLRGRTVDVLMDIDVLVHVDPRLTASALARLLENAAQYAPPDTHVDVETSVDNDSLRISVRDHGPGIAAADLPHLFGRFYRGSAAAQRASGTGMGLSIAQGILAAQGGRIDAENCADGGARFTIVVPAKTRIAAATTGEA